MIRFRMVNINIDQFAILSEKSPADGISYNVSIGFNAAKQARRLACVFSVEFLHDNRPDLKLGISCEFDIHSEDWDRLLTEDIITISKNDLGFFANQTVGAARGILFCKTGNTDFRSFILPPIDLTKILNEDLMIDFSDQP